jgi:hypothetical protein
MTRKLAILLFCTLTAFAADSFSGEWLYQTIGPDGGYTEDAPATLKVEGAKLTGQFLGASNGPMLIEDGTVDGDTIRFTLKRKRPDGSTAVYRMIGTLKDGKIEGTAKADMFGQTIDSTWKARRKP